MRVKAPRDARAWAAVALTAVLVFSAGAAGTAATGTQAGAPDVPSEDAFVVSVHGNGNAEVTVVTAFDLTADAEQRAFQRLKRNETERRHLRQRFAGSLRRVVGEVDNRTERDMRTANATVRIADANDTTGVVAVSVTWTNLAVERNGSLVVERPFASGFETERTFVLRAPDGYAVTELTPEADARSAGTVTWEGNSSLAGFEAVMAPNASDGDPGGAASGEQGASGSVPGFGIGGAFAALAAGVWSATRR